jgi:hypothetical protein
MTEDIYRERVYSECNAAAKSCGRGVQKAESLEAGFDS